MTINKPVDWSFGRLTHLGRHKMAAIFQTAFSNTFSWMKMYEFWLKISPNFVPKGPINNIPALVQTMVWRRPGDKPLPEQMMFSFVKHICVTRLLFKVHTQTHIVVTGKVWYIRESHIRYNDYIFTSHFGFRVSIHRKRNVILVKYSSLVAPLKLSKWRIISGTYNDENCASMTFLDNSLHIYCPACRTTLVATRFRVSHYSSASLY